MILLSSNGVVSQDVLEELITMNRGIRTAERIKSDHYDHKFKVVGIQDEVVIRREIRKSGYDFTTLRDNTIRIMWRN